MSIEQKRAGRVRITVFILITALILLAVKLYDTNKDVKLEQPKHIVEAQAIVEAPQAPIVADPVPVPVVETPVEPIEEPVIEPVPEPVQAPQPTPQPVVMAGDCASEIAKYDWDYSTAHAVMMAESGGRAWVVNNNPSTGDYSVGCFQINLYGGNARTRPSEAELQNPAVNVAFAYRLYTGNGNSFIGQWGVCRSKVQCY